MAVVAVAYFVFLAAQVFLSAKKYIHRDLAARNILLTSKMTAKISDFGLCRYSDEELYTAQNVFKLPFKWMAPESLRDVTFSTHSDMYAMHLVLVPELHRNFSWSFGILLYEMFSCGTIPYADIESNSALLSFLESGRRLAKPITCPGEV